MFSFITTPTFWLILKVVLYSAFIWLPILLFIGLFEIWVSYRRAQFLAKQTYTLLEIKLPRDIFKSPRAMEFFINSLYQPFGEGNWYQKWWQGSLRPWFSLEIASIGGAMHFFVWTRKGYKNTIEANLYSQYPGIEIYEVPDYTLPVNFDPETVGMMACEFGLTKADVFPIKTYIDYGMDKDPKEEYKIDPLTPLIELFGSMPRDHQAWLQIIIRAHVAETKDPKTGKFENFQWKATKMIDQKWAKAAEEEIKKIHEKARPEKKEGDEKPSGPGRILTKGEQDIISALERSVSKTGFDVGMRAIYVAPKEIWSGDYIGGVIGGVTHFNSNDLNGFKPKLAGSKYAKPRYEFWPLSKRKKKMTNIEKQDILDAYKRRAWFYKPFQRESFVLNSEELATIYHFPGGVSTTPTFTRIGSRKSEAPTNLPI